jgi:hypothetical protein
MSTIQPRSNSLTHETDVDYITPHWCDAGQYEVHCPICDFNCVHIESSQHLSGNDNYDVAPDYWVRGDIVEIQMSCENNHWWKLQIGSHKGNVNIRIVDPKVAPEE